MKPLQSIAMGLVIIALTARFGAYDALADPVGWLLVLLGVSRLPESIGARRGLLATAGLALIVSAVVWWPPAQDFLDVRDESLRWAANLPQIGFVAWLCHALASTAAASGEVRESRWLRTAMVLTIVVGLLPVLVFGGDWSGLEQGSYLAAGLALIVVIWLLFAYAARPWAGGQESRSPSRSGPPDVTNS